MCINFYTAPPTKPTTASPKTAPAPARRPGRPPKSALKIASPLTEPESESEDPLSWQEATDTLSNNTGEVTRVVNDDVQYWLMKAEPESRIEKGHDVKFSIDDLALLTEPEGWDGW